MIADKFKNEFSSYQLLLLKYSSSVERNHIKVKHNSNDAISGEYYSFSNYEKLLILCCWLANLKPEVTTEIFKTDSQCNNRTLRSVTSYYTKLSNNRACYFKHLYFHSYYGLSKIIFDSDVTEEEISLYKPKINAIVHDYLSSAY